VADERARRMGVRVREIIAQVIERQVKDPRLGMVTVTDARLTPDLREATVFYTVWGDDAARAATALALESAKGVIRSAVGKGTGLKHTPSIAFIHDAIPETARHIEELLAQARSADAQVQQLARGAAPAGDPDPYRHEGADGPEHAVAGDGDERAGGS
jgi:ribosome-binding factor A